MPQNKLVSLSDVSSEQGRRLERRALLKAAGLAAVALVLPVRLRPDGLGWPGSEALAASRSRFRRRLPIPRVLTDAQIELRMRKAKVRILPGRKTSMWTYGGRFPGPTLPPPAGGPAQGTLVPHPPP